ncbi:MAG: type II toxin-antitoxin system VapC family toxin [Pyrinomonadaceae bacterium]|jgi:hypothetical protein|nr:type II toxin-antitoxin system VapC family toxin [Pyrinomonadaceae bacterium]
MNSVFTDTSGWLAIVNSADFYHEKAVKIYQELLESGCNFVLHEAILLELGNSLSSVKARKLVLNLKENIEKSERIEVVSISTELYQSGWKLFAERLDKDWGIVDCISFVVMKEFGIAKALTTDKHFEQAGFIKLL